MLYEAVLAPRRAPNPLIWSYEPGPETYPVFIVDTEGLNATDEEHNHDNKIFLLAILMSSLLIFNSVGAIDENSLNNLSLVLNLTKILQVRNNATDNDVEEMAEHFPGFLWVLRDFSLKLEDEDGNLITSKKYLERSLTEQKGSSDQTETKNRIRRLIKHFFRD